MEVRFFDGTLEKFINNLDDRTIAKTLRTIDLLERFGHELSMPHSKKINNRIFELRVRGQQEVRIFYTYHKHVVVLLHGFIKKSQKTPRKELSIAVTRVHALDIL